MGTPNYTASQPGEQRRRIWRATCENPVYGLKYAEFHEQDVIKSKDGTELILNGVTLPSLRVNYSDPSQEIELRHPETDAVLGKTTLAQVLINIYSLGRFAQLSRDKAVADAEAAAQAAAQE